VSYKKYEATMRRAMNDKKMMTDFSVLTFFKKYHLILS